MIIGIIQLLGQSVCMFMYTQTLTLHVTSDLYKAQGVRIWYAFSLGQAVSEDTKH